MTGLSAPGTAKGRMQRQVLAVLREHQAAGALPTSVRFVFYELVQRGLVSKRPTGARRPDQAVAEAAMRLREAGLVPWEWIADDTRTLADWQHAPTVAAYLREAAERARVNPWGDTPPPLILCESRTFGGVLSRTLAPAYLCPVAATNGQVGGFLHTTVAPLLVGNARQVLYVGDHDLAGDQIEANTRRVLVRAAGRELGWRRVALTADQVAQHGLEPIEKGDRRHRDGGLHLAVEVEALGQVEVTDLIRAELDALLPEPLEAVREREAAQRETVAAALERL